VSDVDIEFAAPTTPPLTESELAALNGTASDASAIPAEPFVGLTNEQVLALTFDDERQLVEDLVEAGVVGVVAGVPEAHKSWVAQAIAVGVARGEGEILERRVIHGGAVGYFWQDDSQRNEAERVKLYSQRHELTPGIPLTWFLNEGLQLPRDLRRLRATVEKDHLVLVVLDSFYNVASDADLKDRDAGQIFAALKSDVCDQTGCTALVVDHMPWATDQNRGRLRTYGDVYKGAALCFGIYVDADKNKLWVEARGNNIRGFKRTPAYWDADALELRLVARDEGVERDLQGEIATYVAEHPGSSTNEIARGVSAGRDRVSTILKSGDLFTFEAGPNRSRLWVAREAETHPGHLFAPSEGSGGLTGGPSIEGHHRATDAAGGLGGPSHSTTGEG
jgi:hypothetical protein